MTDGAVWVADAIKAMSALPEENRSQLLASLGMGLTAPAAPGQPRTPNGGAESERARPEAEEPGEVGTPLLDLLEPVERGRPERSPPAAAAEPPAELAGIVVALHHRPLLSGGRERRVLEASFARLGPSREMDLPEAVRRAARLRPLSPLPLRSRWRFLAGTQVLVDIGSGMGAFRADQDDVVRSARRLLGVARLRVLTFRQTPTRPAGSGEGPVWTWQPYRPPPRGTPVLILTDLGLGSPLPDAVPAAPFEWAALFDLLARQGVVPVVLVPYPLARVPAVLRRRALHAPWDVATRPTPIRTAVAGRSRRRS